MAMLVAFPTARMDWFHKSGAGALVAEASEGASIMMDGKAANKAMQVILDERHPQ